MRKIDRPKTENHLPGVLAGKRTITAYDPGMALVVCEAVAEGKTLTEALGVEGAPSRATWYRWVMLYPELSKAFDAARKISAEAMEDTLLDMVASLKDDRKLMSKDLVQRYQVAMVQLRWSAERRDPAKFGNKQDAKVVVPIQINTSLDLGQGKVTADVIGNVYEVQAIVTTEGPEGDPEPQPEENDYEAPAASRPPVDDPQPQGDDLPASNWSDPLVPGPQPKPPVLKLRKGPPKGASYSPVKRRQKNPAAIKAQMTKLANRAKETPDA